MTERLAFPGGSLAEIEIPCRIWRRVDVIASVDVFATNANYDEKAATVSAKNQ